VQLDQEQSDGFIRGLNLQNATNPAQPDDESKIEGYTMNYGDRPILVSAEASSTLTVFQIPEYTEYIEETYRRGIHLNYRYRTSEAFGSNGVALNTRTYYFYVTTSSNGQAVRNTTPPGITHTLVSRDSLTLECDVHASRYVRITRANENSFYLEMIDAPLKPMDVELDVVCYLDNGAVVRKPYHIHLQYLRPEIPIESHSGPAIQGSVFGGGRMANVTGNTKVTVHNADTIYALYGGNDIAGWVQGDEGSTIQIGTAQTNEEHPVHIGWVYGGGCGYYSYSGVYDAAAPPPAERSFATRLGYGQYCFNGNVYAWNSTEANPGTPVVDPNVYDFEYTPYSAEGNHATEEDGNMGLQDGKIGGTLPYIKTAHIVIGEPETAEHYDSKGHDAHEHNDYILIDSVFGGAENAFIGVTADGTPANAITIDVNGGTIMALYGGNNYGGAVADASTVTIDVKCTKLVDEAEMKDNTVYSGYGRDFGIRNLFGGGNLVEGSHAEVLFHGGMVDTAFLGGNNASVKAPIGRIDCLRSKSNPPQLYTIGSTTHNGHFIYTNPTMDTTNGGRNYFEGLEPDLGIYNIRFLYGGNNQAPMKNLAMISLRSGGVGSIYGGGNKGDMLNESPVGTTTEGYMDASALEGLQRDLHDAFDGAEGFITEPPKIGSIVASVENSKIIADYIYGGSRRSNVKHSCGVYMAGGNVHTIFGGNDVSGDVGSEHNGASYVVVTKNAVVQGNVYGGSDGYYHFDDMNNRGHYDDTKLINTMFNIGVDYDPYNEFTGSLIPTQNYSNVYIKGGLIKGDVIAGGNMANVGFLNGGTPKILKDGVETDLNVMGQTGTVRMQLSGGEIWGNVFGGGAHASVYGLSQVFVKQIEETDPTDNTKKIYKNPVILGSLFAGNDCVGKVESFLPYQYNVQYDSFFVANSIVNPGPEDYELAERDNQAHQVSSSGDPLNFKVEDGTYSALYHSYVRIEGSPIINSVYGSGNGAYNYPRYTNGTATWDYDGARTQFESVFVSEAMADQRPEQTSTYIDINTEGGIIDTVFGGGAGCSVEQNVTVLLNNKVKDITDPKNTKYPSIDTMTYVKSLSERLGRHFVGSKSEIKAVEYPNFVGTIFGGNNFDDMYCVPLITLRKGNVKNVYGGANAGDMKGSRSDLKDACGNLVPRVSTHVLVNSDTVTVTDTIFGGCRMSNIDNMAFVDVRKSSSKGIQYLYGGNDISGNIGGNTRVDVSGGHVNRIWGGSNGRYDFIPIGNGIYDVYPMGGYNADNPEENRLTTAGRPDVDSTHVNLWGGTIGASVFTGGSMADCRATCLIVDDLIETRLSERNTRVCTPADDNFDSGLTVVGALYGGGEGRWDDLNARDYEGNRYGNINGSTHVHLYHADNVTSASAYGGGGGGDVYNTYIKTYDTWNSAFKAIFGGCWGSNVNGTTHLVFNGKDLVEELFGGNDFSGYVYATDVQVFSGNFRNIYGGGNGEYSDTCYNKQHGYALAEDYAYMHANPRAYTDILIDGITLHRNLEHPNTEYVNITINAETEKEINVWGNVYGGGKVGTVFPLKKDNNGFYIYREDATPQLGVKLHRIPDTNRVLSSQVDASHSEITFTDPREFAYVVLNIHGGRFHNDVFGGGRGASSEIINEAAETAFNKDSLAYITEHSGDEAGARQAGEAARQAAINLKKRPIVYGLKTVNMDNGIINHSLYGGSETVHDGYPAECRSESSTSMRPSSIVNITGGMVDHNLYGAGYQGNVFGSVYVNIGSKAIDSCTVWHNAYGGSDTGVYRFFKPGNADGPADTLVEKQLMMNESVYSGANWGEAAGSTQLTTQGFYGGESRLYIDGEGYNTTNNDVATTPDMNIKRSILGSGTSVAGGDVHSQVELRNYGGIDHCHPTKIIEAIQRTDSLWMHNSVVQLSGTTDASSVYTSNSYSMNMIDDVCYRGYNITEFVAPLKDVGNIAFYEQSTPSPGHGGSHFVRPYVEVPNDDLNQRTASYGCTEGADICEKQDMVSPRVDDKRHTLLILDNGIDFTIGKTVGSTFNYGNVKGFAYITAPKGFNSLVSAFAKVVYAPGSGTTINPDGGGFMSPCSTENKTLREFTSPDQLTDPTMWDGSGNDEFPYTNYGGGTYRIWRIGDVNGLREREATLLAHINPKKLAQNQRVKVSDRSGTLQDLAIAEVSFDLPASEAGHYYMLKYDEGIERDGSGVPMYLVDSAWSPSLGTQLTLNVGMSERLSDIGELYPTSADPNGDYWRTPIDGTDLKGVRSIKKTPDNTFGLVMVPDSNFALASSGNNPTFDMPAVTGANQNWVNLVISGNQNVTTTHNYCSPKVYGSAGEPVKPSMRFYLTYSPTFTSTFNGTATFYLNEYDASGTLVGPIKIKVNVQTIIDSLADIERDVLAMYNGGRTNEYKRKIVIPGLGQERQLYIEGIRWLPTNYNGGDTTDAAKSDFESTDRFALLGDTNAVVDVSTDYPHENTELEHQNNKHNSHNRFTLAIAPTNNVSQELSSANGWGGGTFDTINLYELLYPTGTDPVKTAGGDWIDKVGHTGQADSLDYQTLTTIVNGKRTKGVKVGSLDGRGSAGLDILFHFDGTRMYDDRPGKGYVGRAELHMQTYDESNGIDTLCDDFTITIYVKTRAHGDTIYVASADYVTRHVGNCDFTVYPYNDYAHNTHYTPPSTILSEADQARIGKMPSLYVQTLQKALDPDIYQEGDVVAIMDTVKVEGNVEISGSKAIHIDGPLGPPIEIIRYDGHHHELPDEASVYRGPMVVVSETGMLSTHNITFNGGAGSQIKKLSGGTCDAPTFVEDAVYPFDKQADTTLAFGPILQVKNGGQLMLQDGTTVHHNMNGYGSRTGDLGADGLLANPSLAGAISVTNGGVVKIKGNVEIKNNFSQVIDTHDVDLAPGTTLAVEKAPGNGSVYVDGGKVELPESRRESGILIIDNYRVDLGPGNSTPEWWELDDRRERYVLKSEELVNFKRANVYLTRTYPTSAGPGYEQAMWDEKTDVITVRGIVGDDTRIGVRKWFPGEDVRDTISIARVTGGNNKVLADAVANGSFIADDDFRVFYNSEVNNATAYFFRCASFKHQWYVENTHEYVDPVYEYYDTANYASGRVSAHDLKLKSDNVLYFGMMDNLCPRGGDSLIYRVQGGFMPYTFTWTDPDKTTTLATKKTPYKNTQVMFDLRGAPDESNVPTLSAEQRYEKYAASMSDTLVLPNEEMASGVNRKWNHLLVTAVDATGECELHKYIDVRILMDRNATDLLTYWPKEPTATLADTANHTDSSSPWQSDTTGTGWSDTARTVHAVASRNFKGVQITPRVWVDRSVGTIKAVVTGDDYVYQYVDESNHHELEDRNFCPGDVIYLYTTPHEAGTRFIMWDFDPYYRQLAPYVVPNHDATVTAYYGPYKYWYEHIDTADKAGEYYVNTYTFGDGDTAGHGFINTYHGDVHIYNEEGLAWLISRVNGLNGQQSRSFRFNRVLIHPNRREGSNGVYDMKDYLWTPLGTQQHPFMGHLFGVSSEPTADLPFRTAVVNENNITDTIWTYDSSDPTNIHEDAWYEPVVIRNIIVNEPQMYSAGFFGFMDSAGLYNIEIQGTLVRGSQYVGGLAGTSSNSYVRRSAVYDSIEDRQFTSTEKPTSILTGHYAIGGLLGKSNNDEINNAKVQTKLVGDAVYSGGAVGYGTSTKVANTYGFNRTRLQGLYLGGIAGYLNGVAPSDSSTLARLFGKRKSGGNPSVVQNNYFRIVSDGNNQRLGGIVGYAESSVIENNYVHGDLQAAHVAGVVAQASNGTQADHNYYDAQSASSATYRMQGDASLGHSSDFSGSGNQVTLSQPAYGTDNLTRALNKWVREHNAEGGHFYTWRSDLTGENFGHPLFGTPDLIPVAGRDTIEACDAVELNGTLYTEDTEVIYSVVDSVEMVDSTLTTYIRIHYAANTALSDTGTAGESYRGHGFYLSATETALFRGALDSLDEVSIILTDTLATAFGCDSVVTLTLTFHKGAEGNAVPEVTTSTNIKVYPNPTTTIVNVEADGLSHVEVYDNEGRTLQNRDAENDHITLDLSSYASGVYYIRIHTNEKVTIQKVIKR
jgi:hypothetical protein